MFLAPEDPAIVLYSAVLYCVVVLKGKREGAPRGTWRLKTPQKVQMYCTAPVLCSIVQCCALLLRRGGCTWRLNTPQKVQLLLLPMAATMSSMVHPYSSLYDTMVRGMPYCTRTRDRCTVHYNQRVCRTEKHKAQVYAVLRYHPWSIRTAPCRTRWSAGCHTAQAHKGSGVLYTTVRAFDSGVCQLNKHNTQVYCTLYPGYAN